MASSMRNQKQSGCVIFVVLHFEVHPTSANSHSLQLRPSARHLSRGPHLLRAPLLGLYASDRTENALGRREPPLSMPAQEMITALSYDRAVDECGWAYEKPSRTQVFSHSLTHLRGFAKMRRI
eukprot:5839390-Pleurochrysis_carterae.AAC.2